MTTNTRKFIVVLFIIAIFATMLSACSPAKLVASAYSGSDPAYKLNVNMSPRLDSCGVGDRQIVLNDADGLGDNAKNITVDGFLDNEMAAHTCIAAK